MAQRRGAKPPGPLVVTSLAHNFPNQQLSKSLFLYFRINSVVTKCNYYRETRFDYNSVRFINVKINELQLATGCFLEN